MRKKLTREELQEYCIEIYWTPGLLDELSQYEIQSVLKFACERNKLEAFKSWQGFPGIKKFYDRIIGLLKIKFDPIFPDLEEEKKIIEDERKQINKELEQSYITSKKELFKVIRHKLISFNNRTEKINYLQNRAIFRCKQMMIEGSHIGMMKGFLADVINWCELEIERIQQIQEPEKSIPDNSQDEENLFCKGMPLNFPREHFRVLTERESINGKPFLTIEAFESFIQRAFLGEDLPKQTINWGHGEKFFIVKRFYQFFNLSCKGYFENTYNCREKYIKLLCDNFTGWGYRDVFNNFGNNKSKKEW